jgi:hypothetical protein
VVIIGVATKKNSKKYLKKYATGFFSFETFFKKMLQIVPDEIFDEIERKEKVVLFFYRNV